MNKKKKEREVNEMILRKRNGITLVALVVTIVILIILATISMVAVLGPNGLIAKTQQGRELHEQGKVEEQNNLDMYTEYSGNYLNGVSAGTIPEKPVEKPIINKDTVTTTDHEKIVGKDSLGNQVVVPKGFKIAEESGTTVKEGIVIEDEIGNQFVWVPVSNINGDGTGKIKVNNKDEEGVEITLGRYTFADNNATNPGKETIVQKGSEYDKTVSESNKDEKYKIKGGGDGYHYEFSQARLTNYRTDLSGENKGINTTAKNLQGFIESVRDHHGYYIGRYEASFGSGERTPTASNINTANYISNQKPLSKPSTTCNRGSNTEGLVVGRLWNYINQGDAVKACRNMYEGNSNVGVESDLLNSYMWDTAIVYIQAMGHSNYANATRGSNTSLKNTGTTGDEKCHIYDMAGNVREWTTEYSTYTNTTSAYTCTFKGGSYNNPNSYVAYRSCYIANGSQTFTGFRPGLYTK